MGCRFMSSGDAFPKIIYVESEVNSFMKKCLAELPGKFGEEIRGLFSE
jgi:hypothetical protein